MNKHPFPFNEHRLISQHPAPGPEQQPAVEQKVEDKSKTGGESPEAKEAAERREALKKKEGTFQPDEAPDEAKKAAELANGAALRGRVKVQKTLTDAKTTANDVMESKEAKEAIEKQLQRTRERDETATETEEGEQTEVVVRRENELEVDTSVQVATGGAGGDNRVERRPASVRVRGDKLGHVLAQMAPGDGADEAPPGGEDGAPPEEASEPPPADSVPADARREIGELGLQIMNLRQQAARSPDKAAEMKPEIDALLVRLNGAKERMRTAKEELRNRPMTKGEKMKADIEDAQDVLNDPTASGLDKLGAAVQWIMGYYEYFTMGSKRDEMYKPPEGEGRGSGGETPEPSPEQQRTLAEDKELREEIKTKGLGDLKNEVAHARTEIAEKLDGPPDPSLTETRVQIERAGVRTKADIEQLKRELAAASDDDKPELRRQLEDEEANLRKNQIDLESIKREISTAEEQDKKLREKQERIDKIEKNSKETQKSMENGRLSAIAILRIFENDGIPQAKEFADLLETVTVNLVDAPPNDTLELTFGGAGGPRMFETLQKLSRDLLEEMPGNEKLGIDPDGNILNSDALMRVMKKLTQELGTDAKQEMEKRERIRKSGNEILRGKGLQMRGADTFKLVVNEMTTIYKFENGKWQWSMAENGAFDDVPQNMWPGGGENATKANAIAVELSGLK